MVLIVGIVTGASVGLLVAATVTTGQLETALEDERVETVLLELDADLTAVAGSSDAVRTTNLDLDKGHLEVTDAGQVTVTRHTLNGSETVLDRSLGAVEYRGDATVVYQSGGVWSVHDGRTSVVSPPSLGFHATPNGTDRTLVVPLTTVSGAERNPSGRVQLTRNATASTLETITVPRGERVTVEVSGPYYRGWAAHFRDVAGSAAVTVDHGTNTATLTLGEYWITDTIDEGIVSSGEVLINTSGTVNSTVTGESVTHASGSLVCDDGSGSDCYRETNESGASPLDEAIAESMTEASRNATAISINQTDEPLTNGTYYVGGDALITEDLTFDLGSGNVTLLVDGDLGLDNAMIVVENESGNNAVRLYVSGDVAIEGGSAGVDVASGEASRFQLYGTSEMHFGMGQSNSVGFTGLVYAPRHEDATGTNDAVPLGDLSAATSSCEEGVDVCLGQGTPTFTGSIVAGSTEIRSDVGLTYDGDLAAVTPVLPPVTTPTHVDHLTVAVSDVEIED